MPLAGCEAERCAERRQTSGVHLLRWEPSLLPAATRLAPPTGRQTAPLHPLRRRPDCVVQDRRHPAGQHGDDGGAHPRAHHVSEEVALHTPFAHYHSSSLPVHDARRCCMLRARRTSVPNPLSSQLASQHGAMQHVALLHCAPPPQHRLPPLPPTLQRAGEQVRPGEHVVRRGHGDPQRRHARVVREGEGGCTAARAIGRRVL